MEPSSDCLRPWAAELDSQNSASSTATEQAAGAGTPELLPAAVSWCLLHTQCSAKERRRRFLPGKTRTTTEISENSLKNASSNLSF